MSLKRTVAILVVLMGVILCQDAVAFYNSSTGRWLNRDPIAELDGPNMYAFAHNAPANMVDKGVLPEPHAYWHFSTYPLKSPLYAFCDELMPETNVVVGIETSMAMAADERNNGQTRPRLGVLSWSSRAFLRLRVRRRDHGSSSEPQDLCNQAGGGLGKPHLSQRPIAFSLAPRVRWLAWKIHL